MSAASTAPEAERAVIAALIRNPDAGAIIRLGISRDLFTLDTTAQAFSAIVDLMADHVQPDAATLAAALDGAAMIEVETSLQAHASAANIAAHVEILKRCQQARQEQAARERLLQAVTAGAPPHELDAIMESIRMASATSGPDKVRFTEVSDLYGLPPSENWLIKRYLPADSLTVMFGSPGCGKSFLAIDLACHVATGRAWRGQAVKAGRVIYIAGEGKNGLAKRFRAWFDRHGEQPRNISLRFEPVALTDPAAVASLVVDIRALPEPPALVVIDTLNRNFGPGDENSTADMTRAVSGMDAIRTATGAAILGVHHSGHAEKGRGRGSSVLFGAVDAEYAVEMIGNTVQLRATKIKDSDAPAPMTWTLEKQPLPWCDSEGEPMDSAVLVQAEQAGPDRTTGQRPRLSGKSAIAERALRDALRLRGVEDNGVVTVSEDDWRQAAYSAGISSADTTPDARRKAFNRAREWLISVGAVACDGGRYWIPPTRTNRTEPDKPDKCPAMSGVDIPTDRPDRTGHTPIGVSGLSGCPDVPAGDLSQSAKQNGGMAEWRDNETGIDAASQQPAPILSKDATRIVVALMQADGNTLRTDTLLSKLAKPRMPRDALANALAELQRTGQAAEIDGAWHLLGGVITI